MIKKVIIFGSGYHGRNALRACRKKKIEVLFFVDNNIKLNNKLILGKKVYSPNIIKNTNFDYIIDLDFLVLFLAGLAVLVVFVN